MTDAGTDLTLHVVSDSTGETAASAVRAATSLFDTLNMTRHMHVFVRSEAQVQAFVSGIEDANALVVYTIADRALSAYLSAQCEERGITAIALLEPLIQAIQSRYHNEPMFRPGRQYAVDQAYLDRMSAIDYAISHDDGITADYLLGADVVLVGVSRTSKTPTCIYLAYQGVKAANVPLVGSEKHLEYLHQAMATGVPVVGLVASPNRLAQVRQHRLVALGRDDTPDYADLERIREEVAEARMFFDRHDIPVIDVTRRSIEETAAEVRAELRCRGIDT
ncbi:MAG: pyruvate, water dikinase regulatory protein [Pseudomonadota bacterium]